METFLGAMMASGGIGGSDLSMCTEGDWESHPAGPIFRAVNNLDADEVEHLLEHEKWQRRVDDLDGDGGTALHTLALHHDADDRDAEAIIAAFENVGANLDRRSGGSMLSSETALHAAACYGNYAVIKALIEAGATVDISDDFGRTPLSRAEACMEESQLSFVGQEGKRKSLDFIKEALLKEETNNNASSNASVVTAQERRGEELRKLGNQHYAKRQWEEATKIYYNSVKCHEDHRTYGNMSAAFLNDAVDRFTSGASGYRGLFKQTYTYAIKAVEMEPTYEKGWYRMSRGYLGFRELPRAKKAAMDGLLHCPASKSLREVWAVLHSVGIPDRVADHDGEEWKEVYERIYVERWIGEVACGFCELNCMSHPLPEVCPFCNCPTNATLSDDDDDMLVYLCVDGTG